MTVPDPLVLNVAVSLIERAPSRPGVPPFVSQELKFVQLPEPLVTQYD